MLPQRPSRSRSLPHPKARLLRPLEVQVGVLLSRGPLKVMSDVEGRCVPARAGVTSIVPGSVIWQW